MPKRVVTGIVTGDKAPKTRRVEVTRLVRHARYGKILRRKTICTAHDEANLSHSGDLVEIVESRPLSRTKRWLLVRVVEQGRSAAAADAAAKRPAENAENPASEVV